MPESVFLLSDTLIAFDHLFQKVLIISHVHLPTLSTPLLAPSIIADSYIAAAAKIEEIRGLLESSEPLRMPLQERMGRIEERKEAVSNVGEEGYKAFVRDLKEHIVKGDIIQAVPSQRLRRETVLHPFNAYRSVIPSLPFVPLHSSLPRETELMK